MKKILNAPSAYVDEMLAGLCAAYPSSYKLAGARVLARAGGPVPGKVGIVTGGGSGQLPVFLGYVGDGLLHACAMGNVFAGPRVADCVSSFQAADGGAGVLALYGNYGGDRMNFEMAIEEMESNTYKCTAVRVADVGVIVVMNLMIGLISPPFGMALFVVAKVGNIPFRDLARETWPLVIAPIVVLMICTFLPGVVMALPNLLLGASP